MIRRDSWKPEHLTTELAVAALAILIVVLYNVAVAALVFGGSLSVYLPVGLLISLTGSAVVGFVIAATTGHPPHVVSAQTLPAAIIGPFAASVALEPTLRGQDEAIVSTVIAVCALTSFVTAGAMIAAGRFGLARLTQFIPFPVVAGFLAATGWLMLTAGFRVSTGHALDMAGMPSLLTFDAFAKWGPALFVAVGTFIAVRRTGNALLGPSVFVGVGILVHIIGAAAGQDSTSLREAGWLFGPFPSADLSEIFGLIAPGAIDWGVVGDGAFTIFAATALTIVNTLLLLSAVEVGTRTEIDQDKELNAFGVANVASGLVGCFPGFTGLGATMVTWRLGARTRWIPILVGLACIIVALVGPVLIAEVPRVLAGVMILFIAAELITSWLIQARKNVSTLEYSVIVVIFAATIAVGFLEAVAIGLLLAAVLFVVNYSRVEVVQHEFTGRTRRSNVERSTAEKELLDREGDRLIVLRLQGFVFFGTASALVQRVRARHEASGGRLEYVLLSFRLVNGIDSSAMHAFLKLRQYAEREGLTIMYSNLEPALEAQFVENGAGALNDGTCPLFHDFDYALEWVEERLLAELGAGTMGIAALLEARLGSAERAGRVMEKMERMEVPAGAYLFRQGDTDDSIYFLESGAMSVLVDLRGGGQLRLRKVRQGTVVGEMSHYLQEPRTAALKADEACLLWRMNASELEDIRKEDPDAAALFHELIARVMAERLRHLSVELQAYRE